VLLGETVRRCEANAIDDDEVCVIFSRRIPPQANFIVTYITSPIRMNLRSDADNRILRSRLLPVRFRQWYENVENLTEPYKIEFCASSESLGDDTDGPVRWHGWPINVSVAHFFTIISDGRYPSDCVAKLIS